MKRTLSIMSMVAMLWGLAAVARAADRSQDHAIQAAVEKKLADEDIGNGNGPWVDVANGVVTLRGKVKSVWAKEEAIKRAMAIDDVRAVNDKLEIAFGESDKKVAEDVARKVWTYAFYTIYDEVNLAVDRGHVTLTGRVTMPYKSEEIGKRASKVLGVQSVTNQITTLPMNVGDERLRRAIAYRIYRDSLFSEFANRYDAPVHIIVERGRVTLVGNVRSNVESRKAELLARSTFGVFGVENKLQIGD